MDIQLILSLVIAFLVLCSGGLLFSLFFNRRFEETLPITFVTCVLILFIFGLLKHLKIGVYFIVFCTALIYILSILKIIKDKNKFRDNYITTGFIIFCISYIILIVLNHDRLCFTNDEFSHWGDCVKAMTLLDDFITNPNSHSYFQNYPPGMALFQYLFEEIYFIVSGRNDFVEWLLFVAYQIFYISFILSLITKDLKPKKAIIYFLCMLSSHFLFQNVFEALNADMFLSAPVFVAMIDIMNDKKHDEFYDLKICSCMVILTLIKASGLLLALFVGIAYLINEKFNFKKLIITVFSIALPKLMWSLNISQNNAVKQFSNPISLNEIFNALFRNNNNYYSDIKNLYFKGLAENGITIRQVNFTINYYILFIVFTLFIILVLFKDRNRFKTGVVVISMTAIYVLGMCYLYIFEFNPVEAYELASLKRYLGTIYTVMLAVCVHLFIKMIEDKKYFMYLSIGLLCCLMVFGYLHKVHNFINRNLVRESISVREGYLELENLINENISEDESYYFISPGRDAYDYWAIKFLTRPRRIQYFNENVNDTETILSLYNIEGDSESFINKMVKDNILYLAVKKCSDEFVDEYSPMFSDKTEICDNSLYKLNLQTLKYERVNK